jgi:hypothetical protein
LQAKRKDSDIAIVTSSFALRVTGEDISHARFPYGGMAAWTTSTPKTEAFLVGNMVFVTQSTIKLTHHHLIGKPFPYATLEEALAILDSEIDLLFDVPGGMPSLRRRWLGVSYSSSGTPSPLNHTYHSMLMLL